MKSAPTDDATTQPLDQDQLAKLLDDERRESALPERRRTAEIENFELRRLRADCRDEPSPAADVDDDDGIPITIES